MAEYTRTVLELPASLPDDAARAALAVFDESLSAADVGCALSGVRMDAPYTCDPRVLVFELPELRAGAVLVKAQEAWTALMQYGQRAPFRVYSEPGSQGLGDLVRWHPTLGPHSTECNENGEVCLDGERVQRIIRENDPAAAVAQIQQVLGSAWEDAWEQWLNLHPCSSAWEPGVGQAVVFHSPYAPHAALNGESVRVVAVVDQADPGDGSDVYATPRFRVARADGEVIDAWPEELHPLGSAPVPCPATSHPGLYPPLANRYPMRLSVSLAYLDAAATPAGDATTELAKGA